MILQPSPSKEARQKGVILILNLSYPNKPPINQINKQMKHKLLTIQQLGSWFNAFLDLHVALWNRPFGILLYAVFIQSQKPSKMI